MTDAVSATQANQMYDAAYKSHYKTKDLRQAFELYKGVIDAHRGTSEAGWARTQIGNIIRGVVPEEALNEAQDTLALTHLPTAAPVAATEPR